MNEARFLELLSSYGAEFSRWPEDERAQAEAFLGTASHRVRDLWDSERSFDQILAVEAEASHSLFLETRVLSRRSLAAVARKPVTFSAQPVRWIAGGALAASAAFGFVVGYGPAARSTQTELTVVEDLYGAGAGEFFLAALSEAEE